MAEVTRPFMGLQGSPWAAGMGGQVPTGSWCTLQCRGPSALLGHPRTYQ